MCQVLLAEADPVLAMSLGLLLREHYHLETVSQVDDLVGCVARTDPSILIVDAAMVLGADHNLLRCLKQVVRPDLRIILTYGPDAAERAALARLLPYCDVLFRKPFAHGELLSTVGGFFRLAA